MQLPVVHCVLIEQFSLKMAIALDEPTLLDNVLYYGLFVGAIFQLICIFAVVFIPQSENEDVSSLSLFLDKWKRGIQRDNCINQTLPTAGVA